jgi:galactofuranose transport system ATP-binding protein
METSPLLQLKNITKIFPGVKALDDVDFTLTAGEIHALLGENGAGKSTLIKVMTGVYQRDGGEISLNGKSISPKSTQDAQDSGISTVYQEVNLLPNLSVAHNIYLGREPYRWGLINWQKMNADAKNLLKRYDLDIDVTQNLSEYSVAVQQLIAIARGVDMSAKVLILDEPTASLDSKEVESLFRILRELKAQGVGIVMVTHFLDQVYAVCDKITVLRNAKFVGEFITAELSRSQLISHMLGKELIELEHQAAHTSQNEGEAILQVKELGNNHTLFPTDFQVNKGQVVGLAGLLGSGRTELCRLIFALDKKHSGQIIFNNKTVNFTSPRDAIIAGFGLCPEDRKQDGIFDQLSIRENLIIAKQIKQGWWKKISLKEQQQLTEQFVKDLQIVTSGIEKPIGQLSGGNQQKVILARWLAADPLLLILDEPTRGIDIGAHAEIIKLIRKLCADGMSLIVASSEIEELVAFSHKVIVLRDRQKVAELNPPDIDSQHIMKAIAAS